MWVIGYFYDLKGPLAFCYILLAYGVLILIFAFAMHFSSRGKENRFLRMEINDDAKEMKNTHQDDDHVTSKPLI